MCPNDKIGERSLFLSPWPKVTRSILSPFSRVINLSITSPMPQRLGEAFAMLRPAWNCNRNHYCPPHTWQPRVRLGRRYVGTVFTLQLVKQFIASQRPSTPWNLSQSRPLTERHFCTVMDAVEKQKCPEVIYGVQYGHDGPSRLTER
jgi:hypothetical protein